MSDLADRVRHYITHHTLPLDKPRPPFLPPPEPIIPLLQDVLAELER